VAVTAAVALVVSGASTTAAQAAGPPPATTQAAQAGYLYGLPLVESLRTRAAWVCHTPVNTFVHAARLLTPADRAIVAPNNDTLYSNAWLDLRKGPVLLSSPKAAGRYYDFQLLDAYTNSFANVGTRTVIGNSSRVAILPPGWSGRLPAGVVTVVVAPTPDVWIIGRTSVKGPQDVAAVTTLQKQYRLTAVPDPTGRPQPMPAAPPEPAAVNCANPPSPQAPASGGVRFYDELSRDLAADPPPAADVAVVSQLRAGGIGAGLTPTTTLPAARVAELAAGLAPGQKGIAALIAAAGAPNNHGWSINYHLGTYGPQYALRAVVAVIGLGANVPSEALYFSARADITGAALKGTKSYRLHFAPGQLPPVTASGFWSVTMYGADRFLVNNAINRYSIGDRTPGLTRNPDGSLDLIMSHARPTGSITNWLPAPAGPFQLLLRLYAPASAAANGTWPAPVITAR